MTGSRRLVAHWQIEPHDAGNVGPQQRRFPMIPECINEITVYCSVCEQPVLTDPRGDVLDSSGRCDQCRP